MGCVAYSRVQDILENTVTLYFSPNTPTVNKSRSITGNNIWHRSWPNLRYLLGNTEGKETENLSQDSNHAPPEHKLEAMQLQSNCLVPNTG
jgi:hypothetical protein